MAQLIQLLGQIVRLWLKIILPSNIMKSVEIKGIGSNCTKLKDNTIISNRIGSL